MYFSILCPDIKITKLLDTYLDEGFIDVKHGEMVAFGHSKLPVFPGLRQAGRVRHKQRAQTNTRTHIYTDGNTKTNRSFYTDTTSINTYTHRQMEQQIKASGKVRGKCYFGADDRASRTEVTLNSCCSWNFTRARSSSPNINRLGLRHGALLTNLAR